jgi:hypothetical protein
MRCKGAGSTDSGSSRKSISVLVDVRPGMNRP